MASAVASSTVNMPAGYINPGAIQAFRPHFYSRLYYIVRDTCPPNDRLPALPLPKDLVVHSNRRPAI